jgi:uncharacterized membrane protein YtjA (UPF0391 family)
MAGRIAFPRPTGAFVPTKSANFAGFPAGTIISGADCFSSQGAVISRAEESGKTEVWIMLSWVVTFLVIALIAGILGFGGIAGASIEIAKAIFFIAIILFLVSAVVGLTRGRTRV